MFYDELFAATFPTEPEGLNVITQETFLKFTKQLLSDDVREVDAASLSHLFLTLAGQESEELHSKSRGWVVHLTRGVAQSAMLSAILSVAIKAVTKAELSTIVIPAILPLLFQIEKAHLSMANQELLICLYRKVGSEPQTAQQLYDAVPKLLRDEINHLDLLNFLDALSLTGHATETSDGLFELRHPDHPRLRIHIR